MKNHPKYEDISIPSDIPDKLFEVVSELIDFIEKADNDKESSQG